jgi:hypothetical protein
VGVLVDQGHWDFPSRWELGSVGGAGEPRPRADLEQVEISTGTET